MKPKEIAARFAAFVWYTNCRQAKTLTIQAEAKRFSKQNWHDFLPLASEGLGRLLLQVAKASPDSEHRAAAISRPTKRQLAAAV